MTTGGMYLTYKQEFRKRALSLLLFMTFVMFLIVDRLTVNVPVPFYSTAAIERMFLWLVPVIPLFVGGGVFALENVLSRVPTRIGAKLFYLSVMAAFFLVPSIGTAQDILSAEANFYVRPNNIQDFQWISENFPNSTVLNSCTLDSGQWLPFFVPDSGVTVMFNSKIKRCRNHNSPKTKSLIAII